MKRAVLTYPPIMCLINPSLSRTRWYGSNMSPHREVFALAQPQHHVINPANSRGALYDGVEHGLHVRGRAADDAKHLGRCRLMLQGLPQFCVAFLQFLEQPDILDRDHRL